MVETLTCPLCSADVAGKSSGCRSCHLPIKDVKANQKRPQRFSRSRRTAGWIWNRFVGLAFYGAIVAWCALQMPASLTFVGPGAVIGALIHVFKGRPWLGLGAFLVVVVLVPLLFWPSMLTGAVGHLTT